MEPFWMLIGFVVGYALLEWLEPEYTCDSPMLGL